jgi:hypothetical protein
MWNHGDGPALRVVLQQVSSLRSGLWKVGTADYVKPPSVLGTALGDCYRSIVGIGVDNGVEDEFRLECAQSGGAITRQACRLVSTAKSTVARISTSVIPWQIPSKQLTAVHGMLCLMQ